MQIIKREKKMFLKNKKSQSHLISVILLIVLIMVFVVIIWNIVHFQVKHNVNKVTIDPLTNRIEFSSDPYYIKETPHCYQINVKRESGQAEMAGIAFEFFNDSGAKDVYFERDKTKLPHEMLETRKFSFCYPQDIKVDNVTKIQFRPIFKDGNNNDAFGIVSKKNVVEKTDVFFSMPAFCFVNPPSGINVDFENAIKLSDCKTGPLIGGCDCYYVAYNHHFSFTIQQGVLPAAGDYVVSFSYERGSNNQDGEDFRVECGGESFDFPDDRSETPDIYRKLDVTCHLDSNKDEVIRVTGYGTNSVHFEGILGIKSAN